ncbi:hypothetical protein KUTeg_019970 [Tegillarca granosa]|uniref:Cholesterol side-chain cleavage enzyme, mitochondrial n=1 Tax=Tegillarca granosa TaxID=220873 RepID=A0ABQ9EE04_TEGGR|nr:hypothetical protein KUTeg_019970 [Tegillarca granosa]
MIEAGGDQSVMKSPFLQSLLSDSNLATDALFSSVVDVFIAGIDSTANTLTFLLTHLAENPEKQQKLYEELQQQFNTSDTLEAKFRNMPYLKACLRESHRLVFPLRDGARRYLDKDMVVGGYLIPKGAFFTNQLVFCNNTICQDEKYFRNPEQFIPERWLRSGGERGSIHPFSCLPFGQGTRSCIGQRFSELETYILITKVSPKSWNQDFSKEKC